MQAIDCLEDLERELQLLLKRDSRLEAVLAKAQTVPLRRRNADFAGLSNIVVAQLLSVKAASTIWERLVAAVVPFTPEKLLECNDDVLLGAGLSNAKMRCLRTIALEITNGLDLLELCRLQGDEAHKRLVEIKGIGPWTADVYLLFCAGHPDVFPIGDVALQNAVGMAFAMETRPKGKELAEIAHKWAPHRGTAARLFWAYYKAMREGQETLPI
ncbi:DNA-3-methyladenine glycosylase family protein [Polycladidibacter stylochi]|uniref:DNA-3-methyladenine glycosylase family protein n=1 Tax=Polycladidibacter stylochi TaxID=1807766 RepID=UPI000833968E|nr:DNA-3-methyladenine glycosylase [Pseudovibrio stylochi]